MVRDRRRRARAGSSEPREDPPRLRCVGTWAGSSVLLGALVAPASATDHFNLESGIPTSIEDIEPIDRGSVEFQAFGRSLWVRGGTSHGEATPRLELGLLENTQFEVGAPLLLGPGVANGNGDVELSVLRKLWDAPREHWWPGLGIEADLRVPTGTAEPGFTNRADAGFTVLLKKAVGARAFHINAGLDWTGDHSDTETLRRTAWSAALGHHAPLTDWLVLVSDLVWRQADDEGTRDVWLLETGVRAQMKHGWIGAIGIGVGLNRGPETPVLTLTLGFQVGL